MAGDLAELEARLREGAASREDWLVYADWLTEQGDLRGELIMKQEDPKRMEVHHEEWLVGWPFCEGTTLEWENGFVRLTTLDLRSNDLEDDFFVGLAETACRPRRLLLGATSSGPRG